MRNPFLSFASRRLFHASVLMCLVVLLLASPLVAQGNGSLQLHFMDVGQGDGAVLISPSGEVVLFDNGVRNNCDKPASYLQQLGVTKIDYLVISHYHADHFGCTAEVLQEFPLSKKALDRGGSYNSATYQRYVDAVGQKRETAAAGTTITLDSGSAHPVSIDIVALNGNGVVTTNENDLSLVTHVRFGDFDAEIGGDLSGYKTGSYEDIETLVAPKVGKIEVYKVHHHGSQYSSNDTWLAVTNPIVGIISTGDGNRYGHPTQECLERLHANGVKTYWTEQGNGTQPIPGHDTIGGNIIVEVEPGSQVFTVTYNGTQVDTYSNHGAATPVAATIPTYAWSKRSNIYHYAACRYVKNISPANLERGDTPPEGKTLHEGCPQ